MYRHSFFDRRGRGMLLLFLSRPGKLVPQTIHVVSMLSIVYNEVTWFGIDNVRPMFPIATGKLEIDG